MVKPNVLVTYGYNLTLMCCAKVLSYKIFTIVSTCYMEVKVRVKTIKKKYFMACEDCNAGLKLNVKRMIEVLFEVIV